MDAFHFHADLDQNEFSSENKNKEVIDSKKACPENPQQEGEIFEEKKDEDDEVEDTMEALGESSNGTTSHLDIIGTLKAKVLPSLEASLVSIIINDHKFPSDSELLSWNYDHSQHADFDWYSGIVFHCIYIVPEHIWLENIHCMIQKICSIQFAVFWGQKKHLRWYVNLVSSHSTNSNDMTRNIYSS